MRMANTRAQESCRPVNLFLSRSEVDGGDYFPAIAKQTKHRLHVTFARPTAEFVKELRRLRLVPLPRSCRARVGAGGR